MKDTQERHGSLTKDELNLAELPFSLPSHRHPQAKESIQVLDEVLDPEGRLVVREWTVRGGTPHGLPLAIDEEVFLALTHFLYQAGFKEREVHFTQYSLFKLLGWGDSQRSYTRLEEALDRLSGVRIRSKESFWDHQERCFLTRNFGLIDNYTLFRKGGKPASEQPYISSVSFNSTIFDSFKAGFLKTLDLDLYLSLRSPIARKLFRLLDKKLHKTPVYEIELTRLANRIALTDSAYPSDIKRHFAGAHEELEKIGFLKNATYIRRGTSVSVRYVMNTREQWVRPARPILPAKTENPLIQELIRRGITKLVAQTLLKGHGEKAIADKLEIFDHLVVERSPMVSKNPAGFLRASIEKDYSPPSGYISRAEKRRIKQEEFEARQRADAEAQAAEEARTHRKNQIEALWTSLEEDERAKIEAEALARLNPFALKCYSKEKANGREASGHLALRSEIEAILAQRMVPTEDSQTHITAS